MRVLSRYRCRRCAMGTGPAEPITASVIGRSVGADPVRIALIRLCDLSDHLVECNGQGGYAPFAQERLPGLFAGNSWIGDALCNNVNTFLDIRHCRGRYAFRARGACDGFSSAVRNRKTSDRKRLPDHGPIQSAEIAAWSAPGSRHLRIQSLRPPCVSCSKALRSAAFRSRRGAHNRKPRRAPIDFGIVDHRAHEQILGGVS